MAKLTYRAAISRGIRQEMERDDRVFLIGEDVAAAGGVFKTTQGLLDEFGPERVLDSPISEQAITGIAMGAAQAGLRPIAEMMFADFVLVCQDIISNQIAKARYMSNGQTTLPLVIRFGSGGGLRFGAQHSQSVENWMMQIPGLKVVAPSTPRDVVGLMAAAVRDPDPVMFIEHKGLLATKEDVEDGEIVDELGMAKVVREGSDATVVAIGMMVKRSLEAADQLADQGIDLQVIDVRSLVPLDLDTIFAGIRRTGRLITVEENPRLCGWGAEIVSLAVEEVYESLDAAPKRITTPHIPLPHSPVLEDEAIPSVDRIVQDISKLLA